VANLVFTVVIEALERGLAMLVALTRDAGRRGPRRLLSANCVLSPVFVFIEDFAEESLYHCLQIQYNLL